MPVNYTGNSNNLTGQGSPNPDKLVVPGKDQLPAAVATAFLAVQNYINNLVSPESGGYASLTGPGETTTPGALTQAGGFEVLDLTGEDIVLLSSGNVGIGGVAGLTLSSNVSTSISGGADGVQLETTSTGKVGFFANTPVSRETITGSRGGNAALASLLTALDTYGLIVDSTTA